MAKPSVTIANANPRTRRNATQPRSALSQWYHRRFAGGGLRMRRIGIVALARRLLIALWRYLEDGVIPEHARLIVSEI